VPVVRSTSFSKRGCLRFAMWKEDHWKQKRNKERNREGKRVTVDGNEKFKTKNVDSANAMD
jgi:hypothetical protein